MKRHTATLFLAIIILYSCGRSDPPVLEDGILRLNDGNIDQAIADSRGFFLVHFSSYDPNCGYCVSSNDRISAIALQRSNDLQFSRITWEPWRSAEDASPDVIEKYWVRGLPMFILYENGKEIWRGTGTTSRVYNELFQLLGECCNVKQVNQ